MAIDTDTSGTRWLYVSNHGDIDGTGGGIVWKFNLTTGSTAGIALTSRGTGDGQFISPDGIAVDPATHDLFVSDRYLSRIQRLHSDGTFVMKWGSSTAGDPNEMHGPCGLAVDGAGGLYIAMHGDYNSDPNHLGQHVVKYTYSGSGPSAAVQFGWTTGQYTQTGQPGDFMSTGPYGVVVSGGTVYASDAYFQRVQSFSATDGHYLSLFSLASGLDPLGLSLDSSGSLWISETSNADPSRLDGGGSIQQVQKYSLSGTYAGITLPEPANNLTAFDCVIDSATNNAYVTNYAGNAVAIFDLSGSAGPGAPVVSDAAVSGTAWTSITNVQVTATNSPTSFSAPDLALYGLSISSSGVISGTPTATASNAKVKVTATNAAGTSAPATITLNVAGATQAPGGAPVVTYFNFDAAHATDWSDLRVVIKFSEPVSGVTKDSFVFTPEEYSVGHGTYNSVSEDDPSTYELHFAYTEGTATDPAAPGALRFDIKTGGSGIVGVNSGLPYAGAGVTAAVVPVSPHLNTGAQFDPVVTSFTPGAPAGNTVNFVVWFDHEAYNLNATNVTINTVSGTPTAMVGYIQPAPQDNGAKVFIIPITFSGTGSISLTLSDPGSNILDGNGNPYVGPNTSDVFTLPATTSIPPYVNNAVVQGTVGTAIPPVQVVATNSPTHYDAPNLASYGLLIDGATGVISGTPTTTANSATVNVTATNAGGTSNSATITLQLTSNGGTSSAAPVVTSATTASATAGAAFSYQITATNSPTSYGATNLSGTGLSLNTASGVISGTPSAAGTITTQVTAANSGGTSTPVTLTITVSSGSTPPAAPVVTSATTASATAGAAFSYQITATNSPTSYGATNLSGTGLSLNTASGVISGTPSAAGTITTQVTAANSGGTSTPVTLTITVSSGSTPPAAPVVTSATTASATAGAAFSYQITATNSPTSYGATNLSGTGLSLNTSTGLISGTPSTAGTITSQLTAANGGGTSTPVILTISVATVPPPPPPPASAPTVTSATVTVTVGTPVSYTVSATNDPTQFSLSGQPGGIIISNTGLISGTTSLAGTYRATVTATNAGGFGTGTITFNVLKLQHLVFSAPTGAIMVGQAIQLGATTDSGLPIIYSVVSGPATVSGNTLLITAATPVTVRASASGSSTYAAATADIHLIATMAAQTIPSAPPAVHTDSALTLAATSSSGLPITYTVVSGPATVNGNVLTFTGTGTVVLHASQAGNDTYAGTTSDITISANPIPRLINISARAKVSANDADGATIAGFVVTGSAPKQFLIRAVGPSLATVGVGSPLADPTLKLYDSKGAIVATNHGWNDDPQISAAGDAIGAFKLAKGSNDAAILATLAPGTYTAQVQSADHSGTVLVEVYDVTANAAVPTKQLVNISTRGVVGTGDDAIVGGFVIGGNEPKKVLIRAVGPSLARYGVSGALADPVLTVYDSNQAVIATNDNWEAQVTPATGADITAAEAATGAFPLDSGTADAAITLTLNPGSYTVIVRGSQNTTGNALMEIYEVPSP